MTTAESCTGGLIAACLTEVSGASDVFDRSYVTYSNEAKASDLNVPFDLIDRCGAVSEQVAKAMALGGLEASGQDVSVAVTGIAGPSGGTPEKPVGLVYIASAHKGGALIGQKCLFGDIGRSRVREETVLAAFDTVFQVLEDTRGS